MPTEDQNTKKNEPKKIHKLQEYVPPEKKKKTDEIEIEIQKHIFTIMAQKLKEKHENKLILNQRNRNGKELHQKEKE